MFGEVYPDPVRVVSIGKPVEELLANPAAESNRQYSVEFCGGTHLKHTGDARAFALISEEGIAKVCCASCALPAAPWVALPAAKALTSFSAHLKVLCLLCLLCLCLLCLPCLLCVPRPLDLVHAVPAVLSCVCYPPMCSWFKCLCAVPALFVVSLTF